MFLLEPNRTQFDLNWRMFGIPVRVHPMFWIMSICLGWNAMEDGFQFLLLWVACVFVSILVHELGHVVMGLLFGTHGHIVLYSFGGLAVGSNALSRRWQRIAVSFAGPLAGFLLLGALALALYAFSPPRFQMLVEHARALVGLEPRLEFLELKPTLLGEAISDLFYINLMWGLVNLLPVWPLDGGQISLDVCEGILGKNGGIRVSLIISGVVAGLLAVNALAAYFKHPLVPYVAIGGIYTAIFFGLLALSSFLALQQVAQQGRYRRQEESERMPWERDPDYWKSGRDADHDSWER